MHYATAEATEPGRDRPSDEQPAGGSTATSVSQHAHQAGHSAPPVKQYRSSTVALVCCCGWSVLVTRHQSVTLTDDPTCLTTLTWNGSSYHDLGHWPTLASTDGMSPSRVYSQCSLWPRKCCSPPHPFFLGEGTINAV